LSAAHAYAAACHLPQLTHHASASRYAGCDVYGVAASLATSLAVLAASSTDTLQKSVAYSLLIICAPLLQRVRLCLLTLRQAAVHQAIPYQGCTPHRW
jgi:hypothetical protein